MEKSRSSTINPALAPREILENTIFYLMLLFPAVGFGSCDLFPGSMASGRGLPEGTMSLWIIPAVTPLGNLFTALCTSIYIKEHT